MTGEPYTLLECTECRVLRTWPVPANLEPHYASALGRLMQSTGSRLHAALKGWWIEQELRRITNLSGDATMLDIGCGAGEVAAILQRQGRIVIAADAQDTPPPALAGRDHVSYHPFSFNTYELKGFEPPGGPLVTIVRHVLEHLKDPVAFLRRMMIYGASALYLVVPNAGCLERYLFGRSWYMWDPPRHLWHFQDQSLRRLLQTAGLQVVETGYDTIPNVMPSLYRWGRLHGIPERRLTWANPKSTLSTLCAPLNLLLPHNVLWCIARLP